MNWKRYFSGKILERGKKYYSNGQVSLTEYKNGKYMATVRGSSVYNVFIIKNSLDVINMTCSCPLAKDGHNCKHMAAVLFKIDEKEKSPKEDRHIKKLPRTLDENSYSYYNFDKLVESLRLSEQSITKAEEIIRNKDVSIIQSENRYYAQSDEQAFFINGNIKTESEVYSTALSFFKDKIIESECRCPKCLGGRSGYYWYYGNISGCEHIAALLLTARDYIIKNNIGDDTNYQGSRLISRFKRKSNIINSSFAGDATQRVSILPRLEKDGDTVKVSFKVGTDKMYVVKSLSDFVDHVNKGDKAKYGKSTFLSHDTESFDASVKYIDFIKKYVTEEERFENRIAMRYGYGYSRSGRVGNSLELYGSRMDDFYQLIENESVECNDKQHKTKRMVSCNTGNPKLKMTIYKTMLPNSNQFEGITVECKIPEIIEGNRNSYYIDGNGIYRLSEDLNRQLKPLLDVKGNNGESYFRIGRNNLSGFYYSVLPQLREFMDVEEEDYDEIHSYLRPEVKFVFYLDAENDNVTCKGVAVYGEEEYSLLDKNKESFRENDREEQTAETIQNWLPGIEPSLGIFHCNCEEERIYKLLESGLDNLLDIGEVQTTDAFRKLTIKRKTKVSIGVSLSNGLLDLEISSSDISQDELLNILDSYRKKKKFHRLRSGDFIDMSDDSLLALSELISGLGLTDKDIEEGTLKIPAYRAMYLDKMLEESEDIYASRDSHFRGMVKDFKTISESDFEEPKSLKDTLRNYQKKGFKWLKTIETYGFGGILADDMGLGKTVQIISVLLSAKEESVNSDKTSIVISPASLVFNWGEEFATFAPELKICLVTGSQDERKELIKKSEDYDVLVTSYDLLKRDIARYKKKEFAYEIIDEAQYIKNHTTAASKAVKVINANMRFALTGTPIENRLSELWSIFDYLMPGFLYSYDVFKKTFETPVAREENPVITKRLQKMVSPFVLRRLKGDVLKELPDKIEKVRFDKFEDKQQKLYDAQVVHMKKTVQSQNESEFSKSKIQILAELMKLRQICCDPALCFENYDGESAKRQGCMELVESAIEGGHKILLFSQFTSMLEILRNDFKKKHITFYEITGVTPKEKRIQLVNAFNRDETDVFLISLKAGGTGLNLTGADVVIHYDPWWNLAVQNQATDRAHRIGQTKVVTEYKLIAKNTIEEKIQELQNKKKDLADQIISGEGTSLSSMSKEELMELLEV